MDKLTALRVFHAAAEAGSFAAAGRRLGVSAAAVSKNIAELEDHLKARLFNRTTRQVSLTEAGAAYLARVGPLLADLDRADESVAQLTRGPTGVLRVAAPASFSIVCLSRVSARFLAAYPEMSLHLDLDDRKVDIVAGGHDLAIRGSRRLDDSSLTARKLVDLPHVLCAAPGYLAQHGTPSTPHDLESHACLSYALSEPPGEWQFTRGADTARVPVRARFAATSSLALREAALEGMGLALLPLIYVSEALASGRLVRVLPDWHSPTASMYAIYPSRTHLAPKLSAYVNFLVDELRRPDTAAG